MRISISPITVTTDDGDVVCSEAEVSVAVSTSVAMRIVPIDPAGLEHSDAAVGIVGTNEQNDIAAFLDAVTAASAVLLTNRGV